MNKTYKIGEYAIGGIIKVKVENNKVKISAHDWDTDKQIRWFVEETRNGIYNALLDLTSVYYADNIIEDIEKLTTIKEGANYYA